MAEIFWAESNNNSSTILSLHTANKDTYSKDYTCLLIQSKHKS